MIRPMILCCSYAVCLMVQPLYGQGAVTRPDDVFAELWASKAVILDKLGRKEDAASVRKRSEEPVQPGHQNSYWLFHQKLKNWRMSGKLEAMKK